MSKHAVFLDGPIGAGKSSLGRALAERLSGGFIDGDDHSEPGRPWYCSILRTSRAIVKEGRSILETKPVVVIAYPLGCTSWVFFRRRFGAFASPVFVSLRASYEGIVDNGRGRVFTHAEHERIRTMIAEGYGARPFSDVVVDSDTHDFPTTLANVEREVRGKLKVSS